ncbi:GspH/FimT family pseudopilin [Moraxella sp. Pampa]|uniref:GspH/FimT family pseudopilin n=1 Tax=Moraxella sp. Pampa TaxID=3111978 RepID=UPI002B40DF08|nr:GspH/FimT family pseudopilin [Moraxella sp. Pampa]
MVLIRFWQSGFTLVEMMAVLTIVAVLIFFAQPTYIAMMQRIEAREVRRHIHEAIRLAKIESRIRGQDVLICPMNNDVCSKVAQDNLLVFIDTNRNNKFDKKKDIVIIKEALSLRYGIISMSVSAGRDYIKFMGDTGKPRGNFGNIKYCNIFKEKTHSFQIVVNMNGMVSEKYGSRLNIDC